MSEGWIWVSARIDFLPTDKGGRADPVSGSYRPNHNFFGADDREMAIGIMDFPENRSVKPGESVELDIRLSTWPTLTPEIHVGRQWRIQEGSRLVARGTVLKVLSQVGRSDRP